MNVTRKIISSVGLITIIPFLVACYLYTGVSAIILRTGGLIISITTVIITLGIITLLDLNRTLSKLYRGLDGIASGDFNRKIKVEKSSGTEGMAMSINQVSQRLRKNADELEERAILIERYDQEMKKRSYLQKTYYSDAVH